jgi:hypothetical protein
MRSIKIHAGDRGRMIAPLLSALIAAATPAVPVEVTGQCPSAEAVTAALASALGAGAPGSVAGVPKVTDLGDRFSVGAFGQAREYADPGRDCDERARAAAVFIALALNPPLLPLTAPAAGVPAVQVSASPPAPPSPRWFDVGVAARVDGTSVGDAGPALGFELALSGGRRWIGVAMRAGMLASTESQLSMVAVREQRFPLSVAVEARRELTARLTLAGAVGAALVPITLRAEKIDNPQSATRLDAGFRLAAELRFRATSRLTPFADLHAEIFPRAYEIDVDPNGTIGSTGRFWLGASLGLSFAAM